ncbi:uncharacterized protein [Dysidea avara]|uniref:uncharacterized protein n=1 Tax=Dysidea avara TaxID=196820 RepID=UPI00332C8655
MGCCCATLSKAPAEVTGTYETAVPYYVGKCLPSDEVIVDQWLQKQIEEVERKTPPDPLDQVVQRFKDAIESSAELSMFFGQMFAEVPTNYHKKTPTSRGLVKDYHHMLQIINHVLTKPPEFRDNTTTLTYPITAILTKPMKTIDGYVAFLNPKVNYHMKSILNKWGDFLKSPNSCSVLNTDGWFSAKAIEKMGGNFEDDFICDPSKPHYGFVSWDDFFTRKLQPNARPIAYPDDRRVIVNACESMPFRIEKQVTKHGKFWIKGQPYNLKFMLADDTLAEKFVGGTVYQGLLMLYNYHRWHSPVDGKIVKAFVADGTYYSYPLGNGNEDYNNLPVSDYVQGYLTEVAARAIIFIEADNPYIGLMCFIAVGMLEVSSCEITVKEGQSVKKGQQTGTFHFGGSSHCLIFRPGVELEFDFHGEEPGFNTNSIKINSRIATVPK